MINIYRTTTNGKPDSEPLNYFSNKEIIDRNEIIIKTKEYPKGTFYTYAEPNKPGLWAFGGNILYTSNGIFPEFNTPVKLHDRDMNMENNKRIGR